MSEIQEIGKKIDKIRIDYNEFRQIKKWNESAARKGDVFEVLKNKRVFFPLNNFVLDVNIHKHNKLLVLIELENHNPLSARVTGENYYTGDLWTISYKRGENNDGWQFDGNIPQPPAGLTPEKAVETIHVILISIFMYICCKARNRIEKVSPEITRKEREEYQYRDRELYLLNDIVKYVSIHPNRSAIKYRCECWGVRGHIRHYKDGKVVFIEPYKKGKKRDVLEPKSKTYLIERINN